MLNNDELRLHATKVFNEYYEIYCRRNLSDLTKVTDDVFAQHIYQKTGVEIQASTLRQYRNGARFKVQFYMMISKLFEVPLAHFLMPAEDVAADFDNQLKNFYIPIKDFHTGAIIAMLEPERAMMIGVSANTKGLVITKSNCESSGYIPGQIALIDTKINHVTASGDYIRMLKDSPTVISFQLPKVTVSDDSQPPLAGKVIGRIG